MMEWSEQQRRSLIAELVQAVPTLTLMRLEVVALIVRAFSAELQFEVDDDSDLAAPGFAEAFGDVLLIHHTLSSEPFSKDKFEHGLTATLNRLGIPAELAPRGNPGHDLTVREQRWSLKTQADRGIRQDRIHISKFMELGRGRWEVERDLEGLRARMFEHLLGYDRVFTLRCLSSARSRQSDKFLEYELVEIPTALLRRSAEYPCRMKDASKQTPKPGSCIVTDQAGRTIFELYFDGGTERKLQIRDLAKSACRVHATWRFPRPARSR